ncbi:hypothetical protein CANCADRAFT_85610 [Tortispora caseinolytica NRRL Y-17796]|uniref:ATP-dependent RNA helicase n=1 Tax=Tortispora caseinolytica NRRL Y-17796 TaxID=767744 RepID=A0A1E4TKS4_9ASCO|nr:hypothetical protein CANCADRAFT_85610 [Tortispora caseinolytica NRRL Y-17796]
MASKSKKSANKTKHNAKKELREKELKALADLKQRAAEFDDTSIEKFGDLPISEQTASGLAKQAFTKMTEIQKKSIPLALKGRDILGAARTGSGKTLAFLIPLLEKLVHEQWTPNDGLGALVISPTRELAVQIFDVLRSIGKFHTFSAGLAIGGKNVHEEISRVGRMNIMICTPGRILQLLDQAVDFDTSNLKMLVLDEADRILDMGFKGTVDAILDHLPKDRQTMLFSATQTKKVSDLARLSLNEPEYISIHDSTVYSIPESLMQHYIVSPLPDKLSILYSFLRTHLKSKIIVFFSSGKQVRFAFESFRHMRPGIPLAHLHGRQKQTTRIETVTQFSNAKYSCLFATDIVARGLDFPSVDWVIQVDAPEDVPTYVHRVGRTARYDKDGHALMFLTPSEEKPMIEKLEAKKIHVENLKVRESMKQSIKKQLQGLCFKDTEIKYLAQKAFISYVRSVYLQHDKDVFKFDSIPLEEYAESLGLPGAPKVKLQGGASLKERKNLSRQLAHVADDEEQKPQEAPKTKYDRMFNRVNQDILSEHYNKVVEHEDLSDSDDILQPKKQNSYSDKEDSEPAEIISKRQLKAATSKKQMLKYKERPTKLVFDDEGNAHSLYEFQKEEDFMKEGKPKEQIERFIEAEKKVMDEADSQDKEIAREKRLAKKRKRREAAESRSRHEDDADEEEGIPFEQDEDLLAELNRQMENYGEEKREKRAKIDYRRNKDERQGANDSDAESDSSLEDLEALTAKLIEG